ncbi:MULTISPECIES: GNAT family N-acetyltransferase [Gracilibacillus]|uniref:GNAT family N-acetyltransferase n=1 Tax=Gracilibacillus TaxID=74385 RepID=UPI00082421D7|nr:MULTISPECIES: GNAT family N-acetyltransferase [Gracilibacillus]
MEIIEAKNEKVLADGYKVRFEVFVDEQQVPKDLEIDEWEEAATHFVGYRNNQPIAASRMRFVDQYAKMERICVVKAHRNQGLGKELLLFMEDVAKKQQYTKAKLNGQIQAVDFYQHLGYHIVSDEFLDAGIPHVTMVKQLLD